MHVVIWRRGIKPTSIAIAETHKTSLKIRFWKIFLFALHTFSIFFFGSSLIPLSFFFFFFSFLSLPLLLVLFYSPNSNSVLIVIVAATQSVALVLSIIPSLSPPSKFTLVFNVHVRNLMFRLLFCLCKCTHLLWFESLSLQQSHSSSSSGSGGAVELDFILPLSRVVWVQSIDG